MVDEEPKRSSPKQSENGGNGNCLFSPGFRSAAAMAGWDEETLLMASLVVEDTPDRDSKQKRRSDPMFKTPPTNSRRKRRDQRKSPVSNFVAVLDLDEEGILEKKKEQKINVDVNGKKAEKSNETGSGNASIPCIDRLREELSCAICLEICFEPSTTSCGHSFCKKCLRSAADKCGKRCPKCRQLISNGRSCTINTVLWNTIQLLFPQEIEARKVSVGASSTLESSDLLSPPPRRRNQYRSVIQALNSPEGEQLSLERRRRTSNHHQHNLRHQSFRPASVVLLNSRESGDNSVSRRRRRREVVAPVQDDDATLALRLQREEFMGAFGGSEQPPQEQQQHRRSSVATASSNLRAMASRAINLRNLRGR
ncbi:hypothetical protein L1987_43761 [Smallanthus sonchifolius]|uniref:Uncharacterized protein n=1 Tax=Smallanthus sonchifolius TaxID=185202 RepID=A0ACB9GMB6_9ASTR|nr:hypothetical protein L1987_43761 [Smallanthus sonchifolius]